MTPEIEAADKAMRGLAVVLSRTADDGPALAEFLAWAQLTADASPAEVMRAMADLVMTTVFEHVEEGRAFRPRERPNWWRPERVSETPPTLVDAYWRLRDHAAGLRDTKVHTRAQAAHDADPEDTRKYARYACLEWNCRGIETAARELAEMLGVPEHEIERPAGTDG